MDKRIVKNYSYNLLYQIFLLIVPLVLTPYVARVLTENGSGQYSFAYSIVYYFSLIAALGYQYYAQRLVASHQKDKHQQSIDFWELIIVRLFSVGLSLLVYFISISLNIYGEKYTVIMQILSINIFSVAVDTSFFFQGNEMFGKLVLRNIIVKIISIFAIFIFVKSETDLWIYALILSLSALFASISLLIYLPTIIEIVNVHELHPLKHVKPALVLFLPTIATSVYTTLDKTMIGVITKIDSENGNYEYAERLVKIALTAITSLGAVIIPGNSKHFAEGQFDELKNNIQKSINFVLFIGIPLMFGLVAVSDMIVPWYLGPGYTKAATLIRMLSPLIIIIGFSNIFGVQLLIPSRHDKEFTISICCGAVINFLLNIVLIKEWMSYGAAIATVIAEFCITIIMGCWTKKYFSVFSIFKTSVKYLISSIIMFVCCLCLSTIFNPTFLNTLVVVLIGIIIYLMLLVMFKDEFLKTILNNLKRGNKDV